MLGEQAWAVQVEQLVWQVEMTVWQEVEEMIWQEQQEVESQQEQEPAHC